MGRGSYVLKASTWSLSGALAEIITQVCRFWSGSCTWCSSWQALWVKNCLFCEQWHSEGGDRVARGVLMRGHCGCLCFLQPAHLVWAYMLGGSMLGYSGEFFAWVLLMGSSRVRVKVLCVQCSSQGTGIAHTRSFIHHSHTHSFIHRSHNSFIHSSLTHTFIHSSLTHAYFHSLCSAPDHR